MRNGCVFCSPEREKPVYVSKKWRVFLVDDPDYPGFCRVVWNEHIAEMTDLSETDRAEVMGVVWRVEMCIRKIMRPDKVNLASLGNMVPHIHWHIIPRYANDRNFPDSIWSVVKREPDRNGIVSRTGKIPELRKMLSDVLNEQYGLSL